MKRGGIIAAFVVLLSLVGAQAQGPILPGPGLPVASGLDPATTAWVNQVVTNGGTVSGGRQTIVNTFIVCLKTNSLFTTLDRYWLFAGENTQSALTDMVNLVSATNSGATFTANQGYAGDGSSTFVNTNYNPSTNGVNYTQNSAVFGGQDQTNRTTGGNLVVFGAANGAFNIVSDLVPFSGSSNTSAFTNSAGADSIAATTARGSFIASRTGASAGEIYLNGSGITPIASTSSGLPPTAFFVGGVSQGGSLAGASTDQISSFFIASGWNATQAANFETCQNAMMTSIGINVH